MKSLNKTIVLIAAIFGIAVVSYAVNKIPLKPDGANNAVCTVFGSPTNGVSCGKTTAPSGILDLVGNLNVTGTVAAGGISYGGSKTKAQLLSQTPALVGTVYYCSDCTNDTLVVSTATTPGGVASIINRAQQIDWTGY